MKCESCAHQFWRNNRKAKCDLKRLRWNGRALHITTHRIASHLIMLMSSEILWWPVPQNLLILTHCSYESYAAYACNQANDYSKQHLCIVLISTHFVSQIRQFIRNIQRLVYDCYCYYWWNETSWTDEKKRENRQISIFKLNIIEFGCYYFDK